MVGEVQKLHDNILNELAKNENSKRKVKRLLTVMGFTDEKANEFMDKKELLSENIEAVGPWPLFYIRKDHLLDYVSNDARNPWKLLIPTGTFFAIKIDGQVHTSVTLIDKNPHGPNPNWGITEWSSPSEGTFFIDAKVGSNEEKCRPLEVEIPSLNYKLQGCEDPDDHEDLKFKIIKFGPDQKLKSSVFRPAALVFKELAEEAKNPNYNFPRR